MKFKHFQNWFEFLVPAVFRKQACCFRIWFFFPLYQGTSTLKSLVESSTLRQNRKILFILMLLHLFYLHAPLPPPSPLPPSLSLLTPSSHSRPYSVHIGSDGQVQPVNFPVDAISAPDLPRSIRNYCTLSHNEVVCAVAISDPVKHIYTGGKVVTSL